MNHVLRIIAGIALVVIGAGEAMAIEEAKYEVIKQENEFEVRDYATHVVAETVLEGNMTDAGNQAFRLLFRYISGGNQPRKKVEMTAPVSQQPAGQRIKMTAPVGQERVKEGWIVSFMMPGSYTLETLPQPEDPKVTLREVPARRMAAVRYSGFWSEKNYLEQKLKLESWIHKMGFTIAGEPVWARYNSPFTLWFLRRNEILIPVYATSQEKAEQTPAVNVLKAAPEE